MIVEVTINYTAIVNNNASVDIDGVVTVYPLSLAERALLIDAVNAMQIEDVTNKGWLIETLKPASYIAISFVTNIIYNSVTIYDKGGNVFEDSSIYTPLNDLVTSILNTLIP